MKGALLSVLKIACCIVYLSPVFEIQNMIVSDEIVVDSAYFETCIDWKERLIENDVLLSFQVPVNVSIDRDTIQFSFQKSGIEEEVAHIMISDQIVAYLKERYRTEVVYERTSR